MLQQHRLLKDNSNLTGVDSSDDMDMPNVGSLASQGSACARLLPSQYSPGEAYARDNRRWRPHPPQSARARNRRYRRLQELAEGGVWFSDEAMKERDPWLWYEHVGRVEGGERPAPKAAVEEVRCFVFFVTRVLFANSSYLSVPRKMIADDCWSDQEFEQSIDGRSVGGP